MECQAFGTRLIDGKIDGAGRQARGERTISGALLKQVVQFFVGNIDWLVKHDVAPGLLVKDKVALGLNEAGHHLHELYISERCAVCQRDGLRGAEHVGGSEASLEQATRAARSDDGGLGCHRYEMLVCAVVERGADNLSGRVLNKVDKLVAGKQANAERLDPGRQSVLKGLAGEAAPHARLVVKAGDKLLLLSTLGALRTLKLNAQVLLEPFNCMGNAVDKRLDKLGVGDAATNGLNSVDEVLFVVFVNGSDKP